MNEQTKTTVDWSKPIMFANGDPAKLMSTNEDGTREVYRVGVLGQTAHWTMLADGSQLHGSLGHRMKMWIVNKPKHKRTGVAYLTTCAHRWAPNGSGCLDCGVWQTPTDIVQAVGEIENPRRGLVESSHVDLLIMQAYRAGLMEAAAICRVRSVKYQATKRRTDADKSAGADSCAYRIEKAIRSRRASMV